MAFIKKSALTVNIENTNCPHKLEALMNMLFIFKSSRGPTGQCKLLHNNVGGPGSMTMCAYRLLSLVNAQYPPNTIVLTAMKAHCENCLDAGLLMGCLSLELICRTLKSNIPRRRMMTFLGYISTYFTTLTKTPSFMLQNISMGNLQHLKSMVDSILMSKPSLLLSKRAKSHISNVAICAFLSTIHSSAYLCDDDLQTSFGLIHVKTFYSQNVQDSRVINGFLLEAPPSLISFENMMDKSPLKTLSYTSSLAGDYGIISGTSIQTQEKNNSHEQNFILMESHFESVCTVGVDIVFCQKVLNPSIHQMLRKKNILVFHRLGLKNIETLTRLTGGKLLSGTLSTDISSDMFGSVTSVQSVNMQGKQYVEISKPEGDVCTVVLCHHSEQTALELQFVCESIWHSLRLCCTKPLVLHGAGCWQAQLVVHLLSQHEILCCRWAAELSCSTSDVIAVLMIFCESLLALSCNTTNFWIDRQTGHLWKSTGDVDLSDSTRISVPLGRRCQCGCLMSVDTSAFVSTSCISQLLEHNDIVFTPVNTSVQEGHVVDVLLPQELAVKSALSTAALVLSISKCLSSSIS